MEHSQLLMNGDFRFLNYLLKTQVFLQLKAGEIPAAFIKDKKNGYAENLMINSLCKYKGSKCTISKENGEKNPECQKMYVR